MKKRVIYTLPKNTEPTGEVISKVIKDNEANISIFAKLESYMDDTPKMDREPPNELLTINNFADYIVSIGTGYLLGNQVDYKATGNKKLDPLMDNYRGQNIYDLDYDLGEDCSIFGQAFENVYIDENTEVLSAKLSVYNTIVVYDNTFKHNKMFAVYYSQMEDKSSSDLYDVTIWTTTHKIEGVLRGSVFEEASNTEHFFGEVPVIHYFNNKRMKGDYELVISLIDAYNILQTDRVVDREKLVDAILAFYGSKLTEDDRQAIKDNRVVGLPEGSKAEYIVKQVNEADTDVLRQTIAADIHKFSKTPDLTDETFGNAPSGVSILYKLLAFEQNTKKKERQFEASLKERFDLYVKTLKRLGKFPGNITAADIDVVFKRSLPKNDFETSQLITNLEGLVSNETLIGQLSFVNDASEEVKKASKQAEERMKNSNFGTDTPNDDIDNVEE